MEHINYHFRQGNEHRFAYDFKTLQLALQQAGFVEIRRRLFRSDLDSWELGTLYVDAIKPLDSQCLKQTDTRPTA